MDADGHQRDVRIPRKSLRALYRQIEQDYRSGKLLLPAGVSLAQAKYAARVGLEKMSQ